MHSILYVLSMEILEDQQKHCQSKPLKNVVVVPYATLIMVRQASDLKIGQLTFAK